MTAEIKSEQKERLKAEIEALRYQLNPSLSLQHAQLDPHDGDDLEERCHQENDLSAHDDRTEDNLGSDDDMVYSFSRANCGIIDSYVYIMKVRYGDSFDFFIPTSTRRCSVSASRR